MSKHVAYWTDLLDKDVAVAFGPVATHRACTFAALALLHTALIAGAAVQTPPGQPGWHIYGESARAGHGRGGPPLTGDIRG